MAGSDCLECLVSGEYIYEHIRCGRLESFVGTVVPLDLQPHRYPGYRPFSTDESRAGAYQARSYAAASLSQTRTPALP